MNGFLFDVELVMEKDLLNQITPFQMMSMIVHKISEDCRMKNSYSFFVLKSRRFFKMFFLLVFEPIKSSSKILAAIFCNIHVREKKNRP